MAAARIAPNDYSGVVRTFDSEEEDEENIRNKPVVLHTSEVEPVNPEPQKEIVYVKRKPIFQQVIDEVFFSSSMPNYKSYLTTAFLRASNPALMLLFCIDVVLRGIAQVYLCDHPVSGLFICAGLACTSWMLLGYAILGTACATVGAAVVGRPPLADITSGLCGYDGALIGCSCWAFFQGHTEGGRVGTAIVLSFTAGVVHVSLNNVLSVFGLPVFTFAFNLVQMAMLLSVSCGNATAVTMAEPSSSTDPDSHWLDLTASFMLDASVRGVGQFMFADTTHGGGLVIVGIAVASRLDALFAWGGSTVAALVSVYVMQVPRTHLSAVRSGLYGYNAAGTSSVLGGDGFFTPSVQGGAVSLCGAALSVLILTMCQSVFGKLWGLPVLTFPFIITAWLMIKTHSANLLPKGIKKDKVEDVDPTPGATS